MQTPWSQVPAVQAARQAASAASLGGGGGSRAPSLVVACSQWPAAAGAAHQPSLPQIWSPPHSPALEHCTVQSGSDGR